MHDSGNNLSPGCAQPHLDAGAARFALRAIAAFAFFAFLASGAAEDRPPKPPPFAKPISASVERGASVKIVLTASGRTPGQIRFLIRSQPEYGTLGEIVYTGERTAIVEYFNGGQKGIPADEFRFAAQALDSPVSAAANARIFIGEAPVRPTLGKQFDFGDVGVGEEKMIEIEVDNRLGGDGRLQVSVDPPWKLPRGDSFSVAAGARAKIPVTLCPSQPGRLDGEFRILGHPGASAPLAARAVEVFEFSGIGPVARDADGSRSQVLSLANRGSIPLDVALSYPENLGGPQRITLAPGESKKIVARTSPEFLGPITGDAVASSGPVSRGIHIESPPAPARLVASPQRLDFGKVPLAESRELKLTLRNGGGSSAVLVFASPPEVRVVPDPATVILPAGAEKTFDVSFHPAASGKSSAKLEFRAENAEMALEVPILADAGSPEASSPAAAVLPVPRGVAVDFPPVSTSPPPSGASQTPAADIEIVSAEPGKVVMAWPKSGATTFAAEYRVLRPAKDNGPPEIGWEPWKFAKITAEDRKMRAVIFRLPPGTTWYMRFVATGDDAQKVAPSQVFRLSVPPQPRPPILPWLLAGFGVASGAAISAYAAKRRRLSRSEDERRIADLEG